MSSSSARAPQRTSRRGHNAGGFVCLKGIEVVGLGFQMSGLRSWVSVGLMLGSCGFEWVASPSTFILAENCIASSTKRCPFVHMEVWLWVCLMQELSKVVAFL